MKEIGHAEIKPLTLEIVWLEIKRERNQLCKPVLLTLGIHTPVYLIPTQGKIDVAFHLAIPSHTGSQDSSQ